MNFGTTVISFDLNFFLHFFMQVCKSKKQSVEDYASSKCKEFSKLLPELNSEGAGLQAPHEEGIFLVYHCLKNIKNIL